MNGIELTLSLETAGQHNACDSIVAITDGAYEELLEPVASQNPDQSCIFTGATERAGNYTITAELPGFEPQTRAVTVWQDECHVMTADPRVTLLDCSLKRVARLAVSVQMQGDAQCSDGQVRIVHDGEERLLDWAGGGGIRNEDGIMQTYCYYESPDNLPDGLTLEVEFEGYELYEETGIDFGTETCSPNSTHRDVLLTPL